MALNGKIVLMDDRSLDAGGILGFEINVPMYGVPQNVRQVWAIESYQVTGYSWTNANDAVDRSANCVDGNVSCYLGNGNYLKGRLVGGGSGKSVVCEITDIPAPKVKAGIETRYYDDRWQKYLKTKGWVNA